MNIFPRPKLFFVSPWLLAAATALLVSIVVTFTLSNIRREEELMTDSMLQKADTLMRFIHSGSRAGYFSDLRKGMWSADPWHEYVQRVIDHVAEDPDVMFIAVVDDQGKVIAHDDGEKVGQSLDFILPKKPQEAREKHSPIAFRINEVKKEGRIFEAVRLFYPYRSFLQTGPHRPFGHRLGRNPYGQRDLLQWKLLQQRSMEGSADSSYYVLVGLDMSSYDQALRRVKLQTFVLSLIMLLVGLGGWFSLAAVQGYRVSQRTLSEMKLFTDLLLAKLPVGIIATDRDGYITTFNDSAAEMIGARGEDVLARQADSVLPDSVADLFKNGDGEGNRSDGREKEVTVSNADGTKHFLCHLIDVEDSRAEAQGLVLLISDLTQLKGLEKVMRENERLAAVGRMAAGVAHEVRNPLSSIKGLALLLKGKFAEDSSDRETADLLIEQVERMNRTVSELLSFARPAPLNLERISLRELLEETLRLMEADAANNNITARLRMEPDLMDVAADRDRLSQVFINLFLNSIQAMEKGGNLEVSAANSNDGHAVVIRIKDTGSGIPPENLPQLFYPYFTTRKGGTGIGLAISQKIISDHRGSIRVDSTVGEGTTVTVELPVCREAAADQS